MMINITQFFIIVIFLSYILAAAKRNKVCETSNESDLIKVIITWLRNKYVSN